MSIDDAARYLGISYRTIYRHLDKGHLPHYFSDQGTMTIKKNDLDNILNYGWPKNNNHNNGEKKE